MRKHVLVAYATKHGSTREVAEAVCATLREARIGADIRPAGEVKELDRYDAVVLGGSIYMGRWHADAHKFLKRHRDELAKLPVAIFGTGPLTMSDKDAAGSRKQLDSALRKHPAIAPFAVAIFGGVVDPAKLRFPLSHMPASDARDWDAIHAWTETLAAEFGAVAPAALTPA